MGLAHTLAHHHCVLPHGGARAIERQFRRRCDGKGRARMSMMLLSNDKHNQVAWLQGCPLVRDWVRSSPSLWLNPLSDEAWLRA